MDKVQNEVISLTKDERIRLKSLVEEASKLKAVRESSTDSLKDLAKTVKDEFELTPAEFNALVSQSQKNDVPEKVAQLEKIEFLAEQLAKPNA